MRRTWSSFREHFIAQMVSPEKSISGAIHTVEDVSAIGEMQAMRQLLLFTTMATSLITQGFFAGGTIQRNRIEMRTKRCSYAVPDWHF
jgi:hypothetical protein